MANIKNDPANYVKRSDVSSSKAGTANIKIISPSRKREKEFLIVPIDQGFYINFGRMPFPRQRHP